MIQVLTAGTNEIDNVEAAVWEICQQLNMNDIKGKAADKTSNKTSNKTLLKNSVAILQCYGEYIDGGIVAALSDALGFPVISGNTLASATFSFYGATALSLLVLTSDTNEFDIHVVKSIAATSPEAFEQEFCSAVRQRQESPSLVFVEARTEYDTNSGLMLRIMNDALGGAPIFGTVPVEYVESLPVTVATFNKESYHDSIVFIFIYGDICASFFTASVLESNIADKRMVISKSSSNVVMHINDIPAATHFEEVGIHSKTLFKESASIPLILDYEPGTPPMVRNILRITKEGYLVCGGDMPERSSLSIITSNDAAIKETLNRMLDDILTLPDIEGICFFSCIGRAFMLGIHIDTEIEAIRNKLGKDIPFLFAYSAGEFCPVPNRSKKLQNQFHNYSVIACVFRKGDRL